METIIHKRLRRDSTNLHASFEDLVTRSIIDGSISNFDFGTPCPSPGHSPLPIRRQEAIQQVCIYYLHDDKKMFNVLLCNFDNLLTKVPYSRTRIKIHDKPRLFWFFFPFSKVIEFFLVFLGFLVFSSFFHSFVIVFMCRGIVDSLKIEKGWILRVYCFV